MKSKKARRSAVLWEFDESRSRENFYCSRTLEEVIASDKGVLSGSVEKITT